MAPSPPSNRVLVTRPVMILLFVTTSAFSQAIDFDPPIDVWMPGSVVSNFVVDLDGDGDQDFVTALTDRFVVTINPGSMVLGQILQFNVPFPDGFAWVVGASDFDGDGRTDFILQRSTQPMLQTSFFTVVSIDETGQITPLTSSVPMSTSDNSIRDLAVFDLDDDGDDDIVVTGELPDFGLWWFENTDGTLSAPVAIDTNPSSITPLAIGDFTGDGRTDVTFVRPGTFYGDSGETVWGHDPALGVTAPSTIPNLVTSGGLLTHLILPSPFAGDFDGDGVADLGVRRNVVFDLILLTSTRIDIYLNSGNGSSFTGVATGYFDVQAGEFAVGDLDGDGADELVIRSGAGLQVADLDPGPPSFSGGAILDAMPTRRHGLAVADVDADGDLDIVAPHADRLRLHLNRRATPPNFRQIEVVSGPGSALAETTYEDLLVVRLTDPQGQPVAGEAVIATSRTGATFTPASVVTAADGTASFTVTAGIRPPVDEFRFYAYLAHPSGTAHTGSVLPTRRLEIVGGDGQTAPAGTMFPTPLEVRVVDPVTGADLPGIPVFFETNSAGVFTSPEVVMSDANGRASATYMTTFDSAGPHDVTAQAGGSPTVSFDVTAQTSGGFDIAVVSGDLQFTAPGTAFDAPLMVRVTDTQGQGVFGAPVSFTGPPTGDILLDCTPLPTFNVTTDVDGHASITACAGPNVGTFSVQARHGTATAIFTIAANDRRLLVLESGPPSPVAPGQAYRAPIVIRLFDPTGIVPLAGEPVTLVGTAQPNLTTVTDTSGRATFIATADDFIGAGMLSISAAQADPIDIPVFHRGLAVHWVSTIETLAVIYRDQTSGLPIVVAADTPLAAPGVVPSLFGDIHTSLLAPGPSFVALDGIGLFGPPDPTIVTNPSFLRSFPIPGLAGTGAMAVFQVYGFDASQPYPLNGFVSNPVTIMF